MLLLVRKVDDSYDDEIPNCCRLFHMIMISLKYAIFPLTIAHLLVICWQLNFIVVCLLVAC